MIVWYSSYDSEIISDRAHEEYFDSLVEDWKTKDNFNVFLEENYSIDEIFEFTDAERDEARERFADWAREKAENDDVYEPYEVRLASDEVEE